MSYSIEVSGRFQKELKRLVKKYASLKGEYADLLILLVGEPQQGTPIGHNCYKIRLSVASKGKGKSGGVRIITHIFVSGRKIYLLSIYDKSERENISDKELNERLKNIMP
ncbi:MAG: type II toxin-antitoxin system RelE/ParE family toxin [Bacteroidetes bacterium]|nr:type II toxin-antitoxin system RelE/ParE family toxin [Bacteroidota bacterium]